MINARLGQTGLSTKIRENSINSRVKNSTMSSGIRGTTVNTRVISYQTGRTVGNSAVVIAIGTPIGLLLSLTYATVITITPGTSGTLVKVLKPNIRITTN